MNCVANILHKICNASVFFSAYRTCYNSIVKIEQKRKSAFFRGRSFCLEVVEISREERDVYLIPQNFVDTGTILGGTVKLRNAVEAAVLAVGSAVPLFYLPLAFNIRLMIVIAVSVPLGVFGVVGIGGDSLTQFVAHWFRFMKRRRIVTPTPQGNLEANRHRHLALAFTSSTKTGCATFPDVSICRRSRQAPPPTKITRPVRRSS